MFSTHWVGLDVEANEFVKKQEIHGIGQHCDDTNKDNWMFMSLIDESSSINVAMRGTCALI